MTEHKSKATANVWMNPATERLLSKITNLEETLEGVQAQDLQHEQKHIVKICQTYLEKARGYIDRPSLSAKFPFFGRRHPHLVWELLHRVDEYFILLIKDEELYSRAIDVKTSFDLNIKEEKIRGEWIGEEGKFIGVLEQIKKRENIRATAVRAFSPPESRLTFCSFLPGGCTIMSTPVSRILDSSVRTSSALPPLKRVIKISLNFILTASKVAEKRWRVVRLIFLIA